MSESAVTIDVDCEPADVLRFWFEDAAKGDWFGGGDAFDALVATKFGTLHEKLAREIPDDWLQTRDGVLAALIVLDQFSRNIHRGDGGAFSHDMAALNLSHLIIERGWDADYADEERQFLYMPFMHVEDRKGQDRSVQLFAQLNDKRPLAFAEKHRAVIERFGRFPGRNEALGRETTAEEQVYLDEGGGF